MNTRKLPQELCVDIMRRSTCNIKVGAVIVDKGRRICGWGWNHGVKGTGLHAEAHAISRSNRRRMNGGTIYVCGEFSRSLNAVPTIPCDSCMHYIRKAGFAFVIYRDKAKRWIRLVVE